MTSPVAVVATDKRFTPIDGGRGRGDALNAVQALPPQEMQ